MKRRAVVAMLFASAAATAKPLGMRAGRSGSSPPPPPAPPLEDVPGPSGSASFTANFGALDGTEDGIVLYYDTADNNSVDPADWPYRKVQVGVGLTSVTVSGRATGTYYWKAAGYDGTVVGDLGQKFQVTAA
jgi:hypothetical protein